jgi:multidrug efflux pump subunit AcrB
VSLEEGGNITRLGPDVVELAERFAKQLPRHVDLDFVTYQPGVVKRKIAAFVENLVQGVVSVLLVTLVALGLRLGLVVSALVPMTILLSFSVMQILGIGINQMSLAALIISLGLLVDSGIVIAEAILVEVQSGRSKLDAARSAVKELRGPLFVSVGTTVAALSPTILAESATGEYTAPISQVVTITLLGAWVLSMSMTPLLSVALLRSPRTRADPSGPSFRSRGYRAYRSVLRGALRFRWLVLLLAVGLLGGAFVLNAYVPKAFFPGKKVNLVEAELELPFDASFDATRGVLETFETKLDDFRPDTEEGRGVLGYTSFVGSGGIRYVLPYAPEQPRPNYAYVLIQTTDTQLQAELVKKVSRWVEAELPGVTLRMNKLRNGPPIDYPVSIRLSGLDAETLYAHARSLKRRMAEMDGLLALNDNWYAPVKRIRVDVDGASERTAGVTRADVVRALRAQTSGLPVGVFREGTETIPVELEPTGPPTLERLAGLDVFPGGRGPPIPLGRVADLELAAEPGQVFHFDRRRTIIVRADIDPASGLTPFSVWAELRPWLEEQRESWPVGYDFEVGGSVEASGTARKSIFAKVPLAVALILLLLVWQYDSIRKPLTILLMLPFGLVGVILALFLSQKAFGFMSFLGVIALFGVLINNGLVLISEIETRQAAGASPFDATVEASERRARPILLTALTTVGGLVPLALFGGPLFSPLGMAMLGGLVVGTGVTLILCPTIFATLYRIHEEQRS